MTVTPKDAHARYLTASSGVVRSLYLGECFGDSLHGIELAYNNRILWENPCRRVAWYLEREPLITPCNAPKENHTPNTQPAQTNPGTHP